MRDYGKVAPTFWTRGTGKQLRGDADAQLLALYLMTCPAANVLGIFYLPIAVMALETGLAADRVEAALGHLGDVDFALYHPDTEMVWVPNFATHQIGESITSGDKRRTGMVMAEVKRIGKHPFLVGFWQKYAAAYGLGPCPVGGMATIEAECAAPQSTSFGRAVKEQEQEQEQGVRGSPAPIAADAAPASLVGPSGEEPDMASGQNRKVGFKAIPTAEPLLVVQDPIAMAASGKAPKGSRAAKVKATAAAIPVDWQPTPDDARRVAAEGLHLGRLVAEFVRYWREPPDSGSLERKTASNWNKTFRSNVDRTLGKDWLRERFAMTAIEKKWSSLPPLAADDVDDDDGATSPSSTDDDPLADLVESHESQTRGAAE